MLKALGLTLLAFLRPLLEPLILRRRDKIAVWREEERDTSASGMVSEFNGIHRLVFEPFFRRVKVLKTDVARVRELCGRGAVAFVMKNRGQVEYRYFNTLFLKEHLPPVVQANNALTVFWRPLGRILRYGVARLSEFYSSVSFGKPAGDITDPMAEAVRAGKNVLINLTVSRDYLFGLFHTNPLSKVQPLLDLQRRLEFPIAIVPVQFLYDKHPERAEKGFFDLVFGDKSRPGALRKVVLFLMGFRRQPQAKFGEAIILKDFLAADASEPEASMTERLYRRIEESLRIERARITGPKLKPKDTIVAEVLKDPAFADKLRALSGESGEQYDTLRSRARACLQEIAADVSYGTVHFFSLILNRVWQGIFDGVVVKHDQLNRVREVAGRHPVVLVPMHRSHLDYMLITHIFYENNITFPHVCGGINMNFWPVGRLIRRCGGFFIRRRFGGDAVYKESLYAYLKALIAQGYCVEFFIEGTRSRTGKMLKPMFGILGLIVRAWLAGAAEDVYFVPIAVNYDGIPEERSYESEGAGTEKKREGAGELLKARKALRRKYGKVYVEFDEPVSLREYLAERGVAPGASGEAVRNDVREFGYHLTYRMNKAAVVTPISLVSLALLALGRRTFSFENVLERVRVLREYLDYKEVTYSDVIHYSDRWAYGEAVQKLVSRGWLREVRTFEETFFALEPAGRARLDYYKNNILHFFVSLTCTLKVLAGEPVGARMELAPVVKAYERLKRVFESDFTFSSRTQIADHVRRVLGFCASRGFVTGGGDFATFERGPVPSSSEEFRAYASLLDNFLEARLVVLRYLRRNRIQGMDLKSLTRDILEKSRPLYLKGDLVHPEALNGFNVENALVFLAGTGLVTAREGEKGRTLYSSAGDEALVESWIKAVEGHLRPVPESAPVPAEDQEAGIAAPGEWQ